MEHDPMHDDRMPTGNLARLAPPPGGERRLREALRDRDRNTRTIGWKLRSEEHTSELQSLMRISYAVFCLKKKIHLYQNNYRNNKRYYTIYNHTHLHLTITQHSNEH